MTNPGEVGVHVGAGRSFAQHPAGSADTPIEAILDAAVVSWYPPYRAKALGARERLRSDAKSTFAAKTAELLAEDPSRRDLLAPASWRNALRIIGFLAAATALASIVTGLGFTRGSQDPIDATTVAITAGVASVIALSTLGSSLLFPSRMGTPGRLVALSLRLGTVGSLGSVAALMTRRETWEASTPVWVTLTTVAGVLLFVLAVLVMLARRPRAHGLARMTEDDVRALRLRALAAALDDATRTVGSAWQRLPPEVRRALERERDDAIAVLQERDSERIDADWLRSVPPGVHGLPHAADEAHAVMHLGGAQLSARTQPGRYGYFVKRSRLEHPRDSERRLRSTLPAE